MRPRSRRILGSHLSFARRDSSLAIAASSAISAVSQIATGGFSVAIMQVSAIRIGFHLGRGDARAAQMAMWITIGMATLISALVLFIVWPLALPICELVTVSVPVQHASAIIMAATFVGSWLGMIVQILTSGVLGGQGRTLIITLLSFGFELPASIGSVAIMVLVLKFRMPDGLLKINWVNAAVSAIELVVVGLLVLCSDWNKYARLARERQEAAQREDEAAEAAPASVEPLEAAAGGAEAQAPAAATPA